MVPSIRSFDVLQAYTNAPRLAAGFDDHLVKPVEPERLQQALAMYTPRTVCGHPTR